MNFKRDLRRHNVTFLFSHPGSWITQKPQIQVILSLIVVFSIVAGDTHLPPSPCPSKAVLSSFSVEGEQSAASSSPERLGACGLNEHIGPVTVSGQIQVRKQGSSLRISALGLFVSAPPSFHLL